MRRTRVTPLHYLAATDASGDVARQQKITHAHESPFYHYAPFLHPFAITYRGKNIVGYFLNSPSILLDFEMTSQFPAMFHYFLDIFLLKHVIIRHIYVETCIKTLYYLVTKSTNNFSTTDRKLV
jgi:hypothetical protein